MENGAALCCQGVPRAEIRGSVPSLRAPTPRNCLSSNINGARA